MTYCACKDNQECSRMADKSLAYHLAYNCRLFPIKHYIVEHEELSKLRFNRIDSKGATVSDCIITHIGWSQSQNNTPVIRLMSEESEATKSVIWSTFLEANQASVKTWPKLSQMKFPQYFPRPVQSIMNDLVVSWNSQQIVSSIKK